MPTQIEIPIDCSAYEAKALLYALSMAVTSDIDVEAEIDEESNHGRAIIIKINRSIKLSITK